MRWLLVADYLLLVPDHWLLGSGYLLLVIDSVSRSI